MISSDRKFVWVVGVFIALTSLYLCSDTLDNVLWTMYAFGIKDLLIIALLMIFVVFRKKSSTLSSILAIGLSCYLIVPTFIRICCAIKVKFNYIEYRELLNNSEYSYFLQLILFALATIGYYGFRNERKN